MLTSLSKDSKMSQQSYLQVFTDSTANFVVSVLLTPVCNWIREHPDDEVTEEKLLEVLQLPSAKTPQRIPSSTPQPLATGAAKRTRRTTATTSNRPQCKWFFTKGDNIGKQCTGYAIEGSEYCSACKNKKGAGGTGRKAAAAAGTTTKTTSKPPTKAGFTPAAKVSEDSPPDEDADYELTVEDFGVATDGCQLFVDPGSKFVLKESGSSYTVVGFCDNPKDKNSPVMRPMTKAEKEKAKKLLSLPIEDGVELSSQ